MFDFSREHMTFLIGLFFLAVLAMVCVAIFSRGKVSLAGKWVVREYRVAGGSGASRRKDPFPLEYRHLYLHSGGPCVPGTAGSGK